MSATLEESGLPAVIPSPSMRGDRRVDGALRQRIVQAAQELNDVTWGGAGEGEITGMTQRISRTLLWAPWEDEDKDPERVAEMAESLRTEGQKQPLIVVPFSDPRPKPPGVVSPRYMVLDGKARFWASFQTGILDLEELNCLVQVYSDAYSALYSGLVMKASVRELTDTQASRWLRRLRQVYLEARAKRIRVPDWPKQVEWARVLGRSQPTVFRWLAIADLDPEVQEAIEDGRISERAAVEAHTLPRAEQRAVIAELDAERAREGAPTIPREAVRRAVQSRRRGPVLWVESTPQVPAAQLLLEGLGEYETPVAIGIVAHDLGKLLDAALDGMSDPHPALARLQKALLAPEIATFVAQVCATFEQE